MTRALLKLLYFIALVQGVLSVKHHDFKTCAQSGFCHRNRARADRAKAIGAKWISPYKLISPKFSKGVYRAAVKNSLYREVEFDLEVRFQQDGTVRILLDENNGLYQRYNETASYSLVGPPVLEFDDSRYQFKVEASKSTITVLANQNQVVIQHEPIQFTFYRDQQPHLILNERGLLNMEHYRTRPANTETDPVDVLIQEPEGNVAPIFTTSESEPFADFADIDDEGHWEESFGGHKDSKPRGILSLLVIIPL